MVKLLLKDGRIDVNERDVNRRTPLYMACNSGVKDNVEMLVKDDRVEIQERFYGSCWLGNVELVSKFLEDERINLNKIDQNWSSPLHVACKKDRVETVKFLLRDDRIDVNLEDRSKKTPLFLACESGCSKTVKILLNDERIAVNQADESGVTPLFVVCQKRNAQVAQMLLDDERVDLNRLTSNQRSLWDFMFGSGRKRIMEIIFASGRKIEALPRKASALARAKLIEEYIANPRETSKKLRKELSEICFLSLFFKKFKIPSTLILLK